jgi:predicted dehydrogenase
LPDGSPNDQVAAEILVQRQAPVVIATPTRAHLLLVEALQKSADRLESKPPLIVEKPLAGPGEAAAFRRAAQAYGKNRIFALSYYYTEKGLPLIYCWTRRSDMIRYLSFHTEGVAATERQSISVRELMTSLGAMTTISGRIREQDDRSPLDARRRWLLDPTQGGLAYEMLVHLLMLTDECLRSAGARGLADLQEVGWRTASTSPMQGTVNEIGLTATARFATCTVPVELQVAKFARDNDRSFVVHYEDGRVSCDFDRREAEIVVESRGTIFRVSIQDDYRLRYSIQIDLVRRFLADGFWPWSRTDGLDVQLDALAWLDRQWHEVGPRL